VYSNGLMTGTSADTFSPNADTTRGMIVTILYRMAGSPNVAGIMDPFSDVPAGQYFTDAVKWASQNGIVLGDGSGKFGPEQNVTRQDLAVILARYEQFSGRIPPSATAVSFSDAGMISGYAQNAVNTLAGQGIISGEPGNRFAPEQNATRAEVAAMLTRFSEAAK